jgi:beta-glucosidase/6-phospho-beta-glucosidase/beta-galactosidase
MQVEILHEPERKNQSVSYVWTEDKRLLITQGLCKCPKTESAVHGYQKYGVRVFD